MRRRGREGRREGKKRRRRGERKKLSYLICVLSCVAGYWFDFLSSSFFFVLQINTTILSCCFFFPSKMCWLLLLLLLLLVLVLLLLLPSVQLLTLLLCGGKRAVISIRFPHIPLVVVVFSPLSLSFCVLSPSLLLFALHLLPFHFSCLSNTEDTTKKVPFLLLTAAIPPSSPLSLPPHPPRSESDSSFSLPPSPYPSRPPCLPQKQERQTPVLLFPKGEF